MEKIIKKTIIIMFIVICCMFNKVYAIERQNGDLNNDNQISATDLSMLKMYISKSREVPESDTLYVDVNGDGNITVTDVSSLKLQLIELKQELSDEQKDVLKKFINPFFIAHVGEFSAPENVSGHGFRRYIYGSSAKDLGISDEQLKKISEDLGYDHEMKGFGFCGDITTISKIKENYYNLFGKEISQEKINELKNNKDYIEEYDALYYDASYRHANTGIWWIHEIDGEVIGNIYKLQVGIPETYNVTLKRVNNKYYYISIESGV